MENTVTISKNDFEALLRRAEFYTSPNDDQAVSNLSSASVNISRVEYERLRQAVREYYLLRTALLRGGVEQATLDLLTTAQDGADTSHEFSNIKDGRDKYSSNHYPPSLVPIAISKPGGSASHADTLSHNTSAPGSRAIPYNRVSSFGTAASSNDSTSKDEFGIAGGQIRSTVSISSDQRTLVFGNLSEKVTHKDLTNIIRGGRLLDIYIRHDRSGTCAFVSFAEGATEFFAYAKRNDFYLHAKRVEVRWHDRNFHVPSHVMNKVANGVTRNIVIRGATGKITEASIRDDLEHIHNLVIINVRYTGGDAYISTNSVQNALFARTCMMSRGAYKGLKIEWFTDECAAPLPKQQGSSWKTQASINQPRRVPTPLANRFGLLNLDAPDESEEDSEQSTSGVPEYGIGLNWADAGIAAS